MSLLFADGATDDPAVAAGRGACPVEPLPLEMNGMPPPAWASILNPGVGSKCRMLLAICPRFTMIVLVISRTMWYNLPMKKKVLYSLGALLALFAISYAGFCAWYYATGRNEQSVNAQPVSQTCNVDANILLGHINTERKLLGVPALSVDASLNASAHNKLEDEKTNSYFGHNRLDGTPWYSAFLDKSKVSAPASEDIDVNDVSSDQTWGTFKHSPSHYKSLTDPRFTRVGLSTQCVDMTLTHVTGPADNSAYLNQHIVSLTVVHLAQTEVN